MIMCTGVKKEKDDIIIIEVVVITKGKTIWVLKIIKLKEKAITGIFMALKVIEKINVGHLSILSNRKGNKGGASSSNTRLESHLTLKDDVQTGSSQKYNANVGQT